MVALFGAGECLITAVLRFPTLELLLAVLGYKWAPEIGAVGGPAAPVAGTKKWPNMAVLQFVGGPV